MKTLELPDDVWDKMEKLLPADVKLPWQFIDMLLDEAKMLMQSRDERENITKQAETYWKDYRENTKIAMIEAFDHLFKKVEEKELKEGAKPEDLVVPQKKRRLFGRE